jgi:hypothetical protein
MQDRPNCEPLRFSIRNMVFVEAGFVEMPTILVILGWRLFFYSNEGQEPIHVHCKKGDKEAKYWLDVSIFDIQEAHALNLSPSDKREIRKIIFEHYDYVVEQWNLFQERKK